jgi:putative transposase
MFLSDYDYAEFVSLMKTACRRVSMDLLEWCLMPNHWHMAVLPHGPNDVSKFVHWLCGTHAKRWRKRYEVAGEGPLYQRPFGAVPVQNGHHLDVLLSYIAWNPVQAKLCKHPAQWHWGSQYSRAQSSLTTYPVLANNRSALVRSIATEDWDFIDNRLKKKTPIGDDVWIKATTARLNLEYTLKTAGRPKRNPGQIYLR